MVSCWIFCYVLISQGQIQWGGGVYGALHSGWFQREGVLRCEHTTNCQSYSPVAVNFAWLWWSPMVSEALSYGPGGACPQIPLLCFALYVHTKSCMRWLRSPHGCTKLTLCMPPPFSMSGSAPVSAFVIAEFQKKWLMCNQIVINASLMNIQKTPAPL